MWILVLTILGWTNQSGQSVAGIPGFTSEVACVAAGNAWLKNTEEKGSNAYRRAVCVKA